MKNFQEEFRLPLYKVSFWSRVKTQCKLFGVLASKLVPEVSLFPHLQTALASLVMVAILGGGGFGLVHYTYNSDNIIRGDLLYSYKRDMERYKLKQFKNPANRSAFYLVLSDRRLNEAEVAVNRSQQANIFIPKTYAAELTTEQKAKIKKDLTTVSVQNNIAAGLVAESSKFVSLSLQEAGKIKDKTVAEPLFKNIEKKIDEQKTELKAIAQKTEEAAVKQAVETVKNVFTVNEKLLEKAHEVVEQEDISEEAFEFIPLFVEFEFDEDDVNYEIEEEFEELEALGNYFEAIEEAVFEEALTDFEHWFDEEVEAEIEAIIEEENVNYEEAEEILEEFLHEDFDDEDFEVFIEDYVDDWYDSYIEGVEQELEENGIDLDSKEAEIILEEAEVFLDEMADDIEGEIFDEIEEELEDYKNYPDFDKDGFEHLEEDFEFDQEDSEESEKLFEEDEYFDIYEDIEPEFNEEFLDEDTQQEMEFEYEERLEDLEREYEEFLENEEDFTEEDIEAFQSELDEIPDMAEEDFVEEEFLPKQEKKGENLVDEEDYDALLNEEEYLEDEAIHEDFDEESFEDYEEALDEESELNEEKLEWLEDEYNEELEEEIEAFEEEFIEDNF